MIGTKLKGDFHLEITTLPLKSNAIALIGST